MDWSRRSGSTLLLFLMLAGSAWSAPPEFTWINQFAGYPETLLRNAAPSANGFVGATGARTIPVPFRAPDGSLECHVLIRYENGQWSTTGDVGPSTPGGDSCAFLSGSVPFKDVTPFNTSICVGGDFTGLGPDDLNYFACYNAAGQWQQINGPGNGPNGSVEVLAFDGTFVYLGGSFTQVDNAMMPPTSARRIVRTSGLSWDTLDSDNVGTSNGVNSTVTAILPSVSFVYAGVGSGVRQWNPSANDKWTDLGSSNTLNPVRDIEINNTRVAATSSVSTLWGGLPAGSVSEYDAGTMEWSAVGSSSGVNTGFGALAVAQGFFHATGDFTGIDADARGIARLNASLEWEAVPDSDALGDTPSFTDLFRLGGEICGVQQGFGTNQLFFSRGVACNDGQRWRGLAQGINGQVLDIIRYNGAVVAGGEFSAAGDELTNFIAEYRNGDWAPLGGGLVFTGATGSNPGDVRAMAVYQGDLYVSGLFNQADGQDAFGLARWDGQNWSSVGEGLNFPNDPLLVWNDLLVVTGTTPSGLGPILTWDGNNLTEFQDLPGFRTPTAMAVYQGDLVAASVQGGVAVLERWNGSAWETFTDNLQRGLGSINTLLVRDNLLYAGGRFNGQVAVWDGTAWSDLGAGLEGTSFGVEDLVFAEDALIATGWFDSSDGTSLEKLAYFDGQQWYPLGPGLFAEFTGSSGLTLMIDGSTVYLGGLFQQAGNVWAENIGAFSIKLETIFESGFEAQ
ncbi:MAG: hypothetical protein QNJ40_00685 [Xanthomonadales bacterium]|nr:hypothetical protein [Xanthomonadales bacterium]